MSPLEADRRLMALSLRRLARHLRGQPEPPPVPDPDLARHITSWQTDIEARIDLLEAHHDTAIRRQTLLILATIAAEALLALLKLKP